MANIKVVVSGKGKMGREVLSALCRDSQIEAIGVLGHSPSELSLPLPDGSGQIAYGWEPRPFLEQLQPDVIVDFTNAHWTPAVADAALAAGAHLVIGTSGLQQDFLTKIDREFTDADLGVVVAPNFAIGAVVMMRLAAIAAPYFDCAEIVEMHHEQKPDAPSGTAIATAREMAQQRGRSFEYIPARQETIPGTRGNEIDGVAIHSVRMPGLVAHQEVILGGAGQTLTIRHDTIGRECYMPGVLIAVKEVMSRRGLVYGLDKLLGLA